jgi:hypothetical protein
MRDPIKYKINITDLDHGRISFYTALIVPTVAPLPPMSRVRAHVQGIRLNRALFVPKAYPAML